MIVVRSCAGFDELEACVQLQIEVWGYDPSDIIPRKAFLLAQKIGGQVMGAFDSELADAGGVDQRGAAISHTKGAGVPDAMGATGGTGPTSTAESMVAFAMSLPAVKTGADSPDGKPIAYLHSHMLGVREGYRNRGLGARLKLEQRREALARGIRYMEWTFDPLEIKNAFLNIHKLGATVCRYRENFYGVSSSRLQGGLPTDRLVAEWRLDSDRVRAIVEGQAADAPVEVHQIKERVFVPASIYQWKASASDRDKAIAIQLENRRKFQHAFSHGLAVVGFECDAEGNGIFELGKLA